MAQGGLVAEAPLRLGSVSAAPRPRSLWFGKALHFLPGSGLTLPPALAPCSHPSK